LTTDLGPFAEFPDGLAVARELPHRAKVVAIPLQVFCDHSGVGDRSLRWAFCKRPEVLREALDRLAYA
ncbi:MAG: aminotransferase, partial [Candidatus Nanopelagicales bacterium]